jgi:hypothetical protein
MPAHPAILHAAKKMIAKTQANQARKQTGRTRRARARLMTRVITWWASLPHPRPTALTPNTLQCITATDMQRLAPALRALGWTRILRRVNGKPTTLWLPPGSPIKRRTVGRPALYTYF